ncbi:hypothetical protein M432DRAFT_592054 [Thermoascus aurantiacus ATCC 26904]
MVNSGRPGGGFVRHKGPVEGGRETEKAREDDLQQLILSTLAVVIVIGLGDGSPWEPSSITRRQAEFCPSLQATREPRQTVPRKTPGRPLTGPSNGPRWRLLRTLWTAAGTYRVTEAWLEDGVVEPLRGKETKGHLMLMQDSIDLSGTFLAYSPRANDGRMGMVFSAVAGPQKARGESEDGSGCGKEQQRPRLCAKSKRSVHPGVGAPFVFMSSGRVSAGVVADFFCSIVYYSSMLHSPVRCHARCSPQDMAVSQQAARELVQRRCSVAASWDSPSGTVEQPPVGLADPGRRAQTPTVLDLNLRSKSDGMLRLLAQDGTSLGFRDWCLLLVAPLALGG